MQERDVFISYKAEEFEEASWVRAVLEHNGISCWMAPANIPGGSSYAQEIPRAIRGCRVFVLILSEKSQSSKWVPKELDQAINEGKTIMPFMLENCALKDEFNFYLTNVQRYAAYESKAAAMEKMIREIRALLGVGNTGTILFEDAGKPAEAEKENFREVRSEERETDRAAGEEISGQGKESQAGRAPVEEISGQGKESQAGRNPGEEVPEPRKESQADKDPEEEISGQGRKKIFGRRREDSGGEKKEARRKSSDLSDRAQRERGVSWKKRLARVLSILAIAAAAVVLLAVLVPRMTSVEIGGERISKKEKNVFVTERALTEKDIAAFRKLKEVQYINLSGCTIDCGDLSPLLGSSLQNLILADCSLTKEQLESLTISGCPLRRLDLSGNPELSSLELFLPAADTLQNMGVSNTGIRDLSPLAKFPHLIQLYADRNEIERVPSLAGCPELQAVSLSGNRLDSLSFLEDCTKLRVLRVNGNQLTSLEGLERCIELKELQAGGNRLMDLQGLENTSLLDFVFLNDNGLTDAAVLKSSAASLKNLYLRGNQITDIAFLESLVNLEYLNLDKNQIQSLEPLAACTNLKELSVAENQVKSTKGAEKLVNLTYLDLSGNALTSAGEEQTITFGGNYGAKLDLSRNHITELKLDTSRKYTYLSLYGNSISDYSAVFEAEISKIVLDFREDMDFDQLAETEAYDIRLIGCPLNWQVGVRDKLGSYRVSFIEEGDPSLEEGKSPSDSIRGVTEYYK